jgi:hypothetical protein
MTPSDPRLAAAEAVLRLVIPDDRAAAAAGDLAEVLNDKPAWRWCVPVLGIAASGLRGQILPAMVPMLAFACLAWVVFMAAAVAFTAAGVSVAYIGWTTMRVGSEHTGLELLVHALGFDAIPSTPLGALMFWGQALAMWTAAPYFTGTLAARWWAGRELAVCVVMAAMWPLFAYAAPLVLVRTSWSYAGLQGVVGTSESLVGVPLMMIFVLLGGYRVRRVALA